MSHMIRIGRASGNGSIDATVAQLVRLGANQQFPDEEEGEEIKREISPTLARQQLLKMGVRVREGAAMVYIAHRNSELERLFRDTPWSRNWGDSMERLPGAEANVQEPFASGRPQRAVGLTLITVFQAPQSSSFEVEVNEREK